MKYIFLEHFYQEIITVVDTVHKKHCNILKYYIAYAEQ